MDIDNPDEYLVRGDVLKRRLEGSVSDGDAWRAAARQPHRYRMPNDDLRPNMFKARDDALQSRMRACDGSEPWVRELIQKWVRMSGMTASDADFWRDSGFMEAVRAGRDIQIRRFLDDEGWAWIVTRDSPNHWVHKRRLPESVRKEMQASAQRRKSQARSWWK